MLGRAGHVCGEALLLEPLAIEEARLVPGPAVAEHRHDGVPGPERAGHLDRGGDVDPAGAAEEQALLVQQPVDVPHRLGVLDVHGLIDRRALEILRDATDADPLGDRAAAGRLGGAAAHVLIETAPGGSASTQRTARRRDFRYSATPAKVPPVPEAATKASMRPLVCSQISGPVVRAWASRFAVLSNWLDQMALGSEAASRFATCWYWLGLLYGTTGT